MARSALVSAPTATPGSRRASTLHAGLVKLGIVPLPRRGGQVTNELITQLRDDGID